jgi:hypothetical protein
MCVRVVKSAAETVLNCTGIRVYTHVVQVAGCAPHGAVHHPAGTGWVQGCSQALHKWNILQHTYYTTVKFHEISSMALCHLRPSVSSTALFPLYGPLFPLRPLSLLPPSIPSTTLCPSMALCPLYDPLCPLQPPTLSMALYPFGPPVLPLFGLLSPLLPFVSSTALWPLLFR